MIFKRILKKDSRNFLFHESFGSTASFASMPESHFGDGVPLTVEQAGAVDCTAIGCVKVAYSQTKNNYDIDTLWNQTPHGLTGANPNDTLGAMIKNGLLNTQTNTIDKRWVSYLQVNKNPNFDAFDACRSAMMITQSSINVASNFYAEWESLVPNEVIPQGKNIVSEHYWTVLDWTTKNGELMFWVDFDLGQRQLIDRNDFNTEMAKLGCGSYLPYTQAVSNQVEIGFLQQVINLMSLCGDYFANSILALRGIVLQLQS